MASRLLGMTGGGVVFGKTGPDFSTEANDLNSGYENVTPADGGRGAGDLQTGLQGSAKVNVTMPSDLAGPHGFNMDCDNQNTITDPNKSASVAASPKFQGFDAPMKGSGGGNDAALNGANDGDGPDDN